MAVDITKLNTPHRPTHVEIDLQVITENHQRISQLVSDQKILWVLKANAYGHGLIRIAQHIESIGSDYFGVAYLEEGITLRQNGIKSPILVMGGISGYQLPKFLEHNLTITASSVDKLKQIEECARAIGKQAKVHLNIDTGMERIGIHYYHAHRLIDAAITVRHCSIEGIYTHMANADLPNDQFTSIQQHRFETVLSYAKSKGLPVSIIHAANSAVTLNNPTIRYDMIRCGLLLYGIYPNKNLRNLIELNPALSWKTRVVFFKVIEANKPVSYGGSWTSTQMTRLVTIPLGYGDGYMRAMSNKAYVIIRGQKHPSVGNICMDQLMIDIGWETAYNDDEVVLIGTQEGERITVEDLAAWAGTIPYEILTNINNRVPRVYK